LIDQVNSRAEWLMARINMYRSGDQIVKFTPKLSVDDDGIVQAVKAMYRSTTGEDERAAVNRCNGRERKTSCTVFILAVAGSEANHHHRDPAHARSALPRTFSRRCSRPSCVMGLPGA
jgi:hypothetical protein